MDAQVPPRIRAGYVLVPEHVVRLRGGQPGAGRLSEAVVVKLPHDGVPVKGKQLAPTLFPTVWVYAPIPGAQVLSNQRARLLDVVHKDRIAGGVPGHDRGVRRLQDARQHLWKRLDGFHVGGAAGYHEGELFLCSAQNTTRRSCPRMLQNYTHYA